MIPKEVTLEETCDFLSGFAWSAAKFNSSASGIPIIRIQNVDSSRDKDFIYWDEPYDERFVVEKGDLLLTLSGSFRVGLWDGPSALLNQRIVKLTPKSNVTYEWLLHVLRDRILGISSLGRHALVSNVAMADLRKFSVPLPSISDQRRIAAILDQADALRAKRREGLSQLDSLTQSIFIEMFGDPVANLKNWPKRTLKELGRVKTGGTPPSSKEGMFDGLIPFVTPGDLGRNQPAKRTVTELGASEAETVRSGAALVCCIGATIGKMAKASEFCAFNQQINAVEWSAAIDDDFGIHALGFFKTHIATQGASTTLPILKKSSFEKISIPIPPFTMQKEFADRIGATANLKANLRSSLSEMDDLFSSLQHRAFSGAL